MDKLLSRYSHKKYFIIIPSGKKAKLWMEDLRSENIKRSFTQVRERERQVRKHIISRNIFRTFDSYFSPTNFTSGSCRKTTTRGWWFMKFLPHTYVCCIREKKFLFKAHEKPWRWIIDNFSTTLNIAHFHWCNEMCFFRRMFEKCATKSGFVIWI